MRFSRHAKNRLRRIVKTHPGVSAGRLLEGLLGADDLGYDAKGNRRAKVTVDDVVVTIVVDEDEGLVVTLWLRE